MEGKQISSVHNWKKDNDIGILGYDDMRMKRMGRRVDRMGRVEG